MGVALSVCTLPGQVTSDRLGPMQIELGLGIVSPDGISNCSHIAWRKISN
jgi:dihydroxyacetone kinase